MKWLKRDRCGSLRSICVLVTDRLDALDLLWSFGWMYSGNNFAAFTIEIDRETTYVDFRMRHVGMIRFVFIKLKGGSA